MPLFCPVTQTRAAFESKSDLIKLLIPSIHDILPEMRILIQLKWHEHQSRSDLRTNHSPIVSVPASPFNTRILNWEDIVSMSVFSSDLEQWLTLIYYGLLIWLFSPCELDTIKHDLTEKRYTYSYWTCTNQELFGGCIWHSWMYLKSPLFLRTMIILKGFFPPQQK